MLKRGMGLLGLAAILVVSVPAVSVQAAEPGVITALSEKVYLEKSIGSTVLANVLQGSEIEIIFTEADEAGGLWFYIRTDTGLEGYLPAQSAMAVPQQQAVSEAADTPKESSAANDEETPKEPDEQEQQPDAEAEVQAENELTTLDNVNIREKPSVDSKIKGNIPQGTKVSYSKSVRNEQAEVWYAVSYQGIDGYITESAVDTSKLAEAPEEIETVTQEETLQIQELETQVEEIPVIEENTEQTDNSPFIEEVIQEETQNEEVQAKGRHFHLRLPEKFEILICVGIAACCAILIFLYKKIKRMI